MPIQQYFEKEVAPCRKCEGEINLSPYIKFAKLPPFLGQENNRVLLLGHSPKVRTRSTITVTLDLNTDRKLKQYIVGEILSPLGIDLTWCAATNLVKCFTTQMPEDIMVDGETFMKRAFKVCKSHLIEEVEIAQPRLIISFSEQVATLLQEEFCTDQASEQMKDVFATLRSLSIAGGSISWIPVVHIPKAMVRAHYFPEQSNRLAALRGEVNQILNQRD